METANAPAGSITTAWKNALDSYRKSVPKEDLEQIQQSTSPQDILTYIESLKSHQKLLNVSKSVRAVRACSEKLQRYSGAIDILAQGASQPGCLLWGSIKFALTIVHGNVEEWDKLLRAFVLVGDCLPRVELYTTTFLDSTLVGNHVHALYVSVLHFWARAIKFNKRRKLWKFTRSAWLDYDAEFQTLEAEMLRHRQGVEKAAIAQHISDNSADRVEQRHLNQLLLSANENEQQKEIVRWLAPKEYDAEYYIEDLEYARTLRHPGTCEWIFADAEFKRWSESIAPSVESLLWIHAIPGAGKTVLSSFLIDRCSAPLAFQPSRPVFYFLFKNTDSDKNSTTAAARSLLYQLYKIRDAENSALVEDIKQHVIESGQVKAKNFKTLWSLFARHSAEITGLVIIIDALDECVEPRFLIRGLQKVSIDNKIKIIVTSRREIELVNDLQGWSSMGMGLQEVGADIKAFLEYKVSKSPKLSHPLIRSSILKLLQSRSKGMFLWVALMIKELKTKASIYEIQDALLSLPDGLEKTYERILKRLHDSLKPSPKMLCNRVLKWVLCATRPLKMNELEEALKMEYTGEARLFGFDRAFLYTERDIELACGSLLIVRSGTVQLIHLSAKDFLQKNPSNLSIDDKLQEYLVDVPVASLRIASQCTSYLVSRCPPEKMIPNDISSWSRDVEGLKNEFPFLDYVCFNWLVHLTDSAISSTNESIKMIESFIQSLSGLLWIEICFALDPDCAFLLRMNLQTLLDWTKLQLEGSKSFIETHSNFITIIKGWASSILQLVLEYGNVLKARPWELYFLDPESIFKSSIYSSLYSRFPYQTYVMLNDSHLPSLEVSLPENRYLQRHTGITEDIGFFYFDERRDAFITIDRRPLGNPRIFCQERSTGRKLAAVLDPELENEDNTSELIDACISVDGLHLAVVYYYINDDMDCGVVTTSVWAIQTTIEFEIGCRPPSWAKKLFSSSVATEVFMLSVRPVVFGLDGALSCPSGLVTFSTGDIQALSAGLLNDSITHLSYAEDGKSLICLNYNDEFVIYTLEGQMLSSFAAVGKYPSLCFYSFSCDYIIYSSIQSDSEKWAVPKLQTLSTGIIQKLETPAGSSSDPKYIAFDNHRQIINVVNSSDIRDVSTTYIFIWTGLPSESRLWANQELPTTILKAFVHEQSQDLYILHPGRIWSRINLGSSQLKGLETNADPTHVEYGISQDGTKLGIVRVWKSKATIEILCINNPEDDRVHWSKELHMDGPRVAQITFCPTLEFLLMDNSIYHLSFNDDSTESSPILMPMSIPLPSKDQFHEHRWSCVFSACNNFLAMTVDSPVNGDPLIALDIYRIEKDCKSLSKIEIPYVNLDTYLALKIAFHPVRAELAIGYWPKGGEKGEKEERDDQCHIECFTTNLNNLDFKRADLSPQIENSEHLLSPFFEKEVMLKFSECGNYLFLDTSAPYIFLLNEENEVQQSFTKPSVIRHTKSLSSWNLEFYRIDDCLNDGGGDLTFQMFQYTQDQDGKLEWDRTMKRLTPLPASSSDAEAILLLGDDDHPNLRVLFLQRNSHPKIKYLDFSWEEFESRFK